MSDGKATWHLWHLYDGRGCGEERRRPQATELYFIADEVGDAIDGILNNQLVLSAESAPRKKSSAALENTRWGRLALAE